MQQVPDELAALTLILRARRGGRYLEIGSASGGTARWLHEHVGFQRMFSIDDGGHHRYPELVENFSSLPMKHVKLDSHADDARAKLRQWSPSPEETFDVVFIDGDHSEDGVWQDVELTRPFWSPTAFVILHDIVACDGVAAAWERGVAENQWVRFAEFIGPPCPATGVSLGIGVGVAL